MLRHTAKKWKTDSNNGRSDETFLLWCVISRQIRESHTSASRISLRNGIVHETPHLVFITQMSHLIPPQPQRFVGYPSRALYCCLSNQCQSRDWIGCSFRVCVLLAAHHQIHSVSPVVSCHSLCFGVPFGVKLLFFCSNCCEHLDQRGGTIHSAS